MTLDFLRSRTVTLDCSVLLLLVIGSLDRSYISKFKRTSAYSEEHFEVLVELIEASNLVVSPNILTEASDLLDNRGKKFEQSSTLVKLKEFIISIKENYFESKKLVQNDSFMKFGLADSSVFELCKNGAIAITTDGSLYSYIINSELKAINFNHVIANIN